MTKQRKDKRIKISYYIKNKTQKDALEYHCKMANITFQEWFDQSHPNGILADIERITFFYERWLKELGKQTLSEKIGG